MSGLTRRGVVVAGAAFVLDGCGDGSRGPRASRPSVHGSPTGTGSSRTNALPAVTAWQPDAADLAPVCKLTAARRIESQGNGPDTALQVIDAQYGGLLANAASVLVVTRSWRRDGRHVVADGHTFDVRLSRTAAGWQVAAIHPSHPGPPAATPTTAARRVLADARLVLPPAAQLDVRSGQVHDSVLEAMLQLAATYRIHVSVVRSGHPIFVFGTDRRSDHPQGRAFDTWAIDGHAVVSADTPRALVEEYMHAAAAAGSYNVGGPYLLGAAPQWFSDATHHDHVHAGFAT